MPQATETFAELMNTDRQSVYVGLCNQVLHEASKHEDIHTEPSGNGYARQLLKLIDGSQARVEFEAVGGEVGPVIWGFVVDCENRLLSSMPLEEPSSKEESELTARLMGGGMTMQEANLRIAELRQQPDYYRTYVLEDGDSLRFDIDFTLCDGR